MLSLVLAASLLNVHLGWTDAAPHPRATIHAHRVNANIADLEFASTPITLAAGQWFVSASAAGYWSEPRLVTVSDQATDVALELEPATHLRARVKLPREARASEMTIYLQTTDTQPRSRSVVCSVTGDRAECDVPAGKQDIAFRIAGYASLFRWSETLAAPQANLGVLTFRRGSTFSGRVEMPSIKNTKVDVVLTPASEAMENEAFVARKNTARLVAQPNARSFFAFNVAPGRYVVHASAGDLISDEVEVNVTDGREAMLRDPLRLAARSTLKVNILPARDPWNKRWQVTIRRSSSERSDVASNEGSVAFPSLSPGTYDVVVHRSEIDDWYATSVDVDGDRTLDVAIETIRVRGSVALGGQPLAALVTFCGQRGMRLPVHSKADGSFVTLLPKIAGDKWPRVEVESEKAHVKRTLTDVTLTDTDSPEAFVDLQLPAASIEGIVVQRGGMPAHNALINVGGPGGEFKQVEAEDSTFTVAGLAPGHYNLTAATRDGDSETPVDVELADTTKNVTLIVDAISHLRGAIRSSFGNVMTGSIFVAPSGVLPRFIAAFPVTAEGRFDVRLPPHTDDVVVTASAPGFSFRMLRMPVPRDGDADIAVDQQGGTLVIELDDTRPFIVHNGAALDARGGRLVLMSPRAEARGPDGRAAP
jgi:hypothetical protein